MENKFKKVASVVGVTAACAATVVAGSKVETEKKAVVDGIELSSDYINELLNADKVYYGIDSDGNVVEEEVDYEESAVVAVPITKLSEENFADYASDPSDYDDEHYYYYCYPEDYYPYQIDESYGEHAGMYAVAESEDYTIVAKDKTSEYTVFDGDVAIYKPYYSLLLKRDKLLESGNELTEEEQKIVNDANLVEQVATQVYNENKESKLTR